MPRTSQTELAVLGGLSVEPMTGYGLRAAITETLGHFWHESYGQIYPTLAALEDAGLVERETTGAGSRRRITEAGLVRLRELLAEPFSPPSPRDPLLLRLFFGRHSDPGLTRQRLEQARDAARNRGEELARIHAEVEAEPDSPDKVHWLMVVSAGEHAARARVAWADESLALLDHGRDGGA